MKFFIIPLHAVLSPLEPPNSKIFLNKQGFYKLHLFKVQPIVPGHTNNYTQLKILIMNINNSSYFNDFFSSTFSIPKCELIFFNSLNCIFQDFTSNHSQYLRTYSFQICIFLQLHSLLYHSWQEMNFAFKNGLFFTAFFSMKHYKKDNFFEVQISSTYYQNFCIIEIREIEHCESKAS